MLIQLGKVKQLLSDALARTSRAGLASLGLVHAPEMRDLRLRDFKLLREVLNAIVHLLFLRANNTNVATLLAPENDHRTLLLMGEQFLVR